MLMTWHLQCVPLKATRLTIDWWLASKALLLKGRKSFLKTWRHSRAITFKPWKHLYLDAKILLRIRLGQETALSRVSSLSCYEKALYAHASSMRWVQRCWTAPGNLSPQIWTAQKMIQQVGVTLPKSKPEPPMLPMGKKVKMHKQFVKIEGSAGGTGTKPNDFPKCISVSVCIFLNVSDRI